MCLGPIIGVFVIWQIIKRLGMEYWLRVPRQTRLKQWGQYGLLFVLFIIMANLASYILAPGSPLRNYGVAILLNMIVSTLFLFGVVVTFMQSWIAPEWVRWTAENYPHHYRRILMFASRGEQRRKWRQNKKFEDFRAWVQDFVEHNAEDAARVQPIPQEIPLQSPSQAESLLGKLPLILMGGFSIFLILAVIWIGLGSSFYFFKTVNPGEIGIQLKNGSIKAIVGPGMYSDVGRFVQLRNISCQAISFSVTNEATTQAKDGVNLTIEGSIFRICNDQNLLTEKWARYSDIFIKEEAAQDRAVSIVLLAVKSCVGSYKHTEDITEDKGARLKACLDEESNQLARNIGLRIEDIVISEIR